MTGGSPLRLLNSLGGRWKEDFGSSLAIRTGDRIIVSGCSAIVEGLVRHQGDAAAQMTQALDPVHDAVNALGGTLGDVIRTVSMWSAELVATLLAVPMVTGSAQVPLW
jgi:enamine deaminase RidA (YjgF/YER057c/UK114 family)